MRLLIVLLSLAVSSAQNIKLVDNQYSDILVAVSDSIAEDAQLIDNIQAVLNDASNNMFEATSRRAYMKDVTVLIPATWNGALWNAETATTETFDRAHIRVDQPSGQHGDNPWVQQTGRCGEPGDFMHLSPNFLLDIPNSERKWGPLGKVLVHEWGHLRWGLFDEYPTTDDITEHFYQSQQGIEASRCNTNVQGRHRHRVTGADCLIDPITNLPEDDCRFYPNPAQSAATASLMYYHFLPNVNKFCDDNEFNFEGVHNYDAPSLHNRLCGGQSSWAVMRQSEDFKNGNNPPVDSTGSVNTTINFKFVQRKDSRVVIVMDVSGSMSTNDNYLKLNAAVRRFILYTVQTGTQVGLVKYNSVPTQIEIGGRKTLLKLDTDFHRSYLADQVPLEHGGGTSIGGGLRAAIALLKQNNIETKGAVLKVVTDGIETADPRVATVDPKLRAAGVIIDTILMTQAADNVLISLAASTSGMSFFFSGEDGASSLDSAFTESERAKQSDPLLTPITLFTGVMMVEKDTDKCQEVVIDDALGKDTTISFSWTDDLSMTLSSRPELAQPTSNESSSTDVDTQSEKVVNHRFNGTISQTGLWRVCIHNSSPDTAKVLVLVESSPRPEAKTDEEYVPITVTSRVTNENSMIDFNNITSPPIISALVRRGYAAVIGADVVAVVEGPSANSSQEIVLRDNGAGADVIANDGTYSAFITTTSSNGKHSISVNVRGDKDKAKVKKVVVTSQAGAITEPGDAIETREVQLEDTSAFQRVSLAGLMNVERVAEPGLDLLPPARVVDLAANSSMETGQVTLTWTAVGDDYTEGGPASHYTIYKAGSHKELYKNLDQAAKVNASELKSGNLTTPAQPFETETFVIQLPVNSNEIFVFAIKVFDVSGGASDLSNLASISLKALPAQPAVSTLNITLIVGLTVGIFVVLVIVIAVVVIVFKSKGSKVRSDFTPNAYKNKAYA